MAPATLDRLRSGRDVVAALRARRQGGGSLLVVHALARGDGEPTRLTVLASKRVGGAVERNRAKRILREAARQVTWSPGSDVVLVARAATPDATPAAVLQELRPAATRLGLLAPSRPEPVIDLSVDRTTDRTLG